MTPYPTLRNLQVFLCCVFQSFLWQALEQYEADWHAAQYTSWRSGDSPALQMIQLLRMINTVLEWSEGAGVDFVK
jgi:hypothetical protein